MKKILLSLGALAAVMIALPMFSAFEAHVINVTAQIENALMVPIEAITFGTVFPQEHLDKPLGIELSGSFLTEDRVDDVEYIIRQKPKCALTNDTGTEIIGPTATGHVIPDGNGGYTVDCGDEPLDPAGEPLLGTWGVLPSLCEYISKHPDGADSTASLENPNGNDGSLDSFHQPFAVGTSTIAWLDTAGRLAKSQQDMVDNWTIDLAVPCFGGHCAQDWEDFVFGINPTAIAADYVQDLANEHKVFGCDLWVEVTGVSEATNGTQG